MRIAYRKILGAQLNPFRRQRRNQYKVKTLLHSNQCKVPTKQGIFFLIILFERVFKLMKNGVYFIVIALLVAKLFKILIYAN